MTRVGIVTGAAQGIGRSIALKLATDGIDVGVNDISSKQDELKKLVEEIEAMGRKAIAIPGDVSKEAEVQDMVKKTVDALGGLDVMVANAGIYKAHSILDVPDEWFDKIMAVNCKGVLYCYRAAAAQMIKQGRGGRIIGASSVWGLGGSPMSVSYVAAKFAVRGITQTAAMEWGKHNITVNAYAPGLTDTEMISNGVKEMGITTEDFRHHLLDDGHACFSRAGKTEEVAALVGFLASEGASYVTAQTYSVNGGMVMT